jgi:hypothetical protein
MTVTEWWSFIAGTVGFIWAVVGAGYLLIRLQSPWQMTIRITQRKEELVNGHHRRVLTIEPGTYIVEMDVRAERKMKISKVSIALKSRRKRCEEVKVAINDVSQGTADWSVWNIVNAPRLLLVLPRLEICPTSIAQIVDIKDTTSFHDKRNIEPKAQDNMWEFLYDPTLELEDGEKLHYSIKLDVPKPKGSNEWSGKLEFCGIKPVRRRVKIGKRTIV